MAWAEEEFARREQIRWVEPDTSDAFLRVKGARDLTPRGLAVLRELHEWREGVARERDQATFRILPNQAMIELSLRPPTSLRQLREVKGVGAGLIERRGQELMAAIQRGLNVPEAELPQFPPARRWARDPEVEERAERLRAVRTKRATELDLDPGFLMARALIDEIARRNPGSVEELLAVPDIRRWQVDALGASLLEALRS